MRQPLQIMLILGIFGAAILSCSGGGSQLKVSTSPKNATLIPIGETTCGGDTLTAPYYIINSIRMEWSGTDQISIQSLTIKTRELAPGGGESTCAFGGEDLLAAMRNDTTIDPPTPGGTPTSVETLGLCCGTTVVDDEADSFNMTGTVKVRGATINVDSGETTGRATGIDTINIQ